MNEKELERIISNAAASVKMEGLVISEQTKDLCRALLNKEISFEEYMEKVKASVEIEEKNNANDMSKRRME